MAKSHTWYFLIEQKQRRQGTISSHCSRSCDFRKSAAELSAYIKTRGERPKTSLDGGSCLTNGGLSGEVSTRRADGVYVACASICLRMKASKLLRDKSTNIKLHATVY